MFYTPSGAKLREEKFARKLEANNATMVLNIEYPNLTIIQVQKTVRFKDKMYSLSASFFDEKMFSDTALDDITAITNTFALFEL